jgi:hypothetical protein
MQPPVSVRPLTPPHHPTHGVHMSFEQIHTLCSVIFPSSKLLSTRQLPSGGSFNNRIYFLQVTSTTNHSCVSEYVLKVNGQFFGADKVQNEVSCLHLLAHHCPGIPVPRVVAWSGDGDDISLPEDFAKGSGCFAGDSDRGKGRGWILTTLLPGTPLSSHTLDEPILLRLSRELAGFVANWRLNIPLQKYCGNVQLCSNLETNLAPLTIGDQPFSIIGLVTQGVPSSKKQPIISLLQYYTAKLTFRLHTLKTNANFEPNRQLVPLIESFIANYLPLLPLFHSSTLMAEKNKFVFTHYDLSPRNILISDNPPSISGIVDFEFSGFFPPFDEFVNDEVDNGGDWGEAAYRAYIVELERLGVPTPGGVDKEIWEKLKKLGQLEESIAPWWLAEGGVQGEKRVAELESAKKVVEEAIKGLVEV